ncbi:MAG: HAD-IIA family hydrolase [Candidatus Sulfotelmatobacter sp.]
MARTCLLDIDGVLTVSWKPLPGAVDTLHWMKAHGIRFGLVTNTSTRPRREIAATLNEVGIEVGLPQIFSAVSSAARYLVTRYPGANCLVINEGSLDEDLIGVELTRSGSPDVVLLGGAGASVGYPELDRVFKLAVGGVPVVGLHRNTRFQTADGLALDMGAFIVGLEQAAGIEIPVVGKPSADFFEAALFDLGADAAEAIMVGDDIDADVRGGQSVGMTGVLVKTGKFREIDLHSDGQSPDYVLDDIQQLPGIL